MIFPKKEMIQLYFLATGKLVSFCLIKKSFFLRSKRKNTVCAPSYQGHKPSWRHREIPQNKVNEKLFKNRISSPYVVVGDTNRGANPCFVRCAV